jgi:hypothetical protein
VHVRVNSRGSYPEFLEAVLDMRVIRDDLALCEFIVSTVLLSRELIQHKKFTRTCELTSAG